MPQSKALPETWLSDCHHLLGKYRADAAHAEKVARMSDGLFIWTREFNGLEDLDRIPLVAAGLLHDIGTIVGPARHHRHSAWLIENEEALKIWPDDLRADVAWLALNHRKRRVRDVRGRGRSEVDRLWRIAAILRLADVLDRAHDQRTAIHDMQVNTEEAVVHFSLSGFDLQAASEAVLRKASWAAEAWDAQLIFTCGNDQLVVTPGE
jgi:exopolyphosphatase/guanosine-5'-triphosphate,3'-diphosphate pyrophosphatase